MSPMFVSECCQEPAVELVCSSSHRVDNMHLDTLDF